MTVHDSSKGDPQVVLQDRDAMRCVTLVDDDDSDDDDGYDGYDDAGGGDAGSGDSAWGDEVVNLTPPLSLFCFAASCCPSSLLPLALRSPPL